MPSKPAYNSGIGFDHVPLGLNTLSIICKITVFSNTKMFNCITLCEGWLIL